jgi:hypothetical protein
VRRQGAGGRRCPRVGQLKEDLVQDNHALQEQPTASKEALKGQCVIRFSTFGFIFSSNNIPLALAWFTG